MTTANRSPLHGEVPQYRLTEVSYIDDVYHDESEVKAGKAIVYYEGPPGPHMVPLNAAAKAMVAKYKPVRVDPLAAFTVITAAPAVFATPPAENPLPGDPPQ